MKYYIIAGEASGDLHGSKLIEEIKKSDPNSESVSYTHLTLPTKA